MALLYDSTDIILIVVLLVFIPFRDPIILRINTVAWLFRRSPSVVHNGIGPKVGFTVSHVAGGQVQNLAAFNALQEKAEIDIFPVKPVGHSPGKIGMITTQDCTVIGIDDSVSIHITKLEVAR